MLFENYQQRIQSFLEKMLPNEKNNRLHQAMCYAVLNGGKRLRPLLVYTTGECLKTPLEKCDAPAAAVELIHSYSLIHDDLPAMDNDDMRRNKPSCHKQFDEATAILAGDALQTLAFEILPDHQMVQTLAHAARQMVEGQMLDMADNAVTLEQIQSIYQAKTGALIHASIQLGLIAANCQDTAIQHALTQYAQYIGLAFQIQDDIIDAENETESPDKKTIVSLTDIESAKQQIKTLYEKALKSLQSIQAEQFLLAELVQLLIERNH